VKKTIGMFIAGGLALSFFFCSSCAAQTPKEQAEPPDKAKGEDAKADPGDGGKKEAEKPDDEKKKPAEKPDAIHVVDRGDTLANLAAHYGTTIEQIKLASHKTEDIIRIGERLRISWAVPSVRVSKKELKLQLISRGKVVKEYPIGIGTNESQTPEGAYTVGVKLKNPDWFPSVGKRVPFGDPRNILGTRWMALEHDGGTAHGYGIHGTSDPKSVPGRSSAGCLRMINHDVEELFEWVPKGTKVTVTEE
jgi:lipoprotein-anchoring transpeptidase ErfK/SrfK